MLSSDKRDIVSAGLLQRKTLRVLGNISTQLILVLGITPSAALSEPLSHEAFIKLAVQCAPSVSPTILEAVARTESGLNPWVLHDNTSDKVYQADNLSDATATAELWIARGDSVDIGTMQINSANLAALRLSVVTALNPCASLAGGAAILRAAYGGGTTSAAQQIALLMALSRYNTGSPFRGIMNGYTRAVLDNDRDTIPHELIPDDQFAANLDPSEPPAWNVSATGTYALIHGAPWLVSLVPLSTNNINLTTSQARRP